MNTLKLFPCPLFSLPLPSSSFSYHVSTSQPRTMIPLTLRHPSQLLSSSPFLKREVLAGITDAMPTGHDSVWCLLKQVHSAIILSEVIDERVGL